MPQPILFPNYPQNVTLTTAQAVTSLVWNVPQIANVPASLVTSALDSASRYLQDRCRRSFVPSRVVKTLDGNGQVRYLLPTSPLMNVNSVSIYYNYPTNLTLQAYDYNFIQDRENGLLAFPVYTYSLYYQPFGLVFYRSSKNVTVDFWAGYTEEVYGDTLTNFNSDGVTYPFNQLGVIKDCRNTVNAIGPTTPIYGPVVYVNGVALQNTTYVNVGGYGAIQFQVEQDNIYYTLNQDVNGYSSITFNTPQTGVVTADYRWWQVPADVAEAASKRAAITLLNAIATAPLNDPTMAGATSLQIDGFRVQYADKGQWGPQMANWETEIETVVTKYRLHELSVGYNQDNDFSTYFPGY